MNNKVFVSCAVTGSGDTAKKHPDLPKTPEQIANASIEAAKAGAAIAHIHVREVMTPEEEDRNAGVVRDKNGNVISEVTND